MSLWIRKLESSPVRMMMTWRIKTKMKMTRSQLTLLIRFLVMMKMTKIAKMRKSNGPLMATATTLA